MYRLRKKITSREEERKMPSRKSVKLPFQMEQIPVEELIEIREQADRLIRQKISAEKQALLEKLQALQRFESVAKPDEKPRQQTRARPLPKYRNPTTGETWAGRGLQPRWLRKAVEAGHREEDFLLDPASLRAAE
jgi:DNA-binding protein H-NS